MMRFCDNDTMRKTVGSLLKQWRNQRRYSQLQLATELDVSSKHISFIETGRSIPSKTMLVKIATFLAAQKSEVNQALQLAGFSPAYPELPVSDKQLKAINQMIENHLPYPALVLDQQWDLINLNQAAQNLFGELGYSNETNLLEAISNDRPETSKIVNWHAFIFFDNGTSRYRSGCDCE